MSNKIESILELMEKELTYLSPDDIIILYTKIKALLRKKAKEHIDREIM